MGRSFGPLHVQDEVVQPMGDLQRRARGLGGAVLSTFITRDGKKLPGWDERAISRSTVAAIEQPELSSSSAFPITLP